MLSTVEPMCDIKLNFLQIYRMVVSFLFAFCLLAFIHDDIFVCFACFIDILWILYPQPV